MRRSLLVLVLIPAATLVAAEISARYILGLGTPPLSITHPTIEYMFAPNQDVRRFGNRQLYNEYSMRSPLMSEVESDRFVLVFGDSVLNGGNLTDHSDLATTLASNEDVFFGNVSAGSWGPQNIAAWINEYGLLGADTVILVLSSHDLTDFPTFRPLNPQTHPTRNPPLALVEAFQRYLPRYLPISRGQNETAAGVEPNAVDPTQRIEQGREDLHRLLDLAAENSIRACLVLHPEQREIDRAPMEARSHFSDVFSERSVPFLDALQSFADARESGNNPFRDNIHINETGQLLLRDYLVKCEVIAEIPRKRENLLQTQ